MLSGRRAFLTAVAAVLAGCADGSPDEERTEASDARGLHQADSQNRADADPYRSPFIWGTWVPDVVVVNYGLGEVTTAVAVRWPEWARPSFHEQLVLPGRRAGEPPPSVMIPYVRSLGPGSLLTVTTTNGVTGTLRVRNEDVGVRVNLSASDVKFQYITN